MLLDTHVDAPQKPNCRSPVQGLERQVLRRHLPSSSYACSAELRDGNTHACGWTVILKEFCSRAKRQEFFPFNLIAEAGRGAEGEGFRMQQIKRRASRRFNPELKLPLLMSTKN
jgi:hypothetical protein